MYILSMVILIFFAIIGLCTFIGAILDRAYRVKEGLTLIVEGLTPDSAEAQIRAAARICQRHKDVGMVCICGEDSSVKEICRLMKKDYPFIEIRESG